MTKPRFSIIVILASFLLISCGGGSSSNVSEGSSSEAGDQTGLPNDINGLLVFTKMGDYKPAGTYILDIKAGNITRNKVILSPIEVDGLYLQRFAYAHDRKTIVYINRCIKERESRVTKEEVKTVSDNGLVASRELAPCEKNIYSYAISSKELAKLSPDKNAVAIMIADSISVPDPYTVIYDTNRLEPIKDYMNYKFPEWHPDGRLLLTGEDKGLYITDANFSSLARIDQDQLNTPIKNPDISPSGQQIIFEMNTDIWIMDIDGNNLSPLIEDEEILEFPTWSPSGKYIAYLSSITKRHKLKKITFFNVKTKKRNILDTITFFPVDENGYNEYEPYGPLSWVK